MLRRGLPGLAGRASNKEGESWTSIAGLSSESIRRSCAMPLRSRRRVVVGTFAISARSTPRKQQRASCNGGVLFYDASTGDAATAIIDAAGTYKFVGSIPRLATGWTLITGD